MPEEELEKKTGEKKKVFLKRLIFFSGPFKWFAVAGIAFVLSYFVVEKVLTPVLTPLELPKQKKSPPPPREKIGPIYRLEPIIVNLNEEGARRYLKITLNLELNSLDTIKEIELLKPRIVDSLIALLSSKTLKDIEGLEEKRNLRKEIAGAINSHLNTGMVVNVYFVEFVIQ